MIFAFTVVLLYVPAIVLFRLAFKSKPVVFWLGSPTLAVGIWSLLDFFLLMPMRASKETDSNEGAALFVTVPILAVMVTMFVWLTGYFLPRNFERFTKSRFGSVRLGIASFVLVYFSVVAGAAYEGNRLENELAIFGRDGDGFFSEQEQTDQQVQAKLRLASDTGRSFAFIFGFVPATIVGLLTWISARSYRPQEYESPP